MSYYPNPNQLNPNPMIKDLIFLKNAITRSTIEVGDYTYFDLGNTGLTFEDRVTHHYDFIGDKLIIGKFCAIASGIEFIMNGSNHVMSGVTTYPFNIMGNGWEKAAPAISDLPLKGDTHVGHDVWFGQNVTVLPGITIGNGAIIGANSVITRDVPPYTIVGGNPAKPIKQRFTPEIIKALEQLAWWDQDIEWITEHIATLTLETVTLTQLKELKDNLNNA